MTHHDVTRRTLLRLTALAAGGLASATLLAACGGSGPATAATGSASSVIGAASATGTVATGTTATTSATAASTAASSATTSQAAAPATSAAASTAPPKAGTTPLHVMDFALNTPEAKARWEKEKAAFLQAYPQVTIEEDFTDDFSTKLPVLVASGTPPDVAPLRRQAEYPAFAPFGVVIDLNPYMSRSKVLIKDDFYESTIAMETISGKLYALPTTQNPFGLYYNKDLFDAQGVKYPDSTWDYQDWFDAATKLTKYQNGTWSEVGGAMPSWWVIHYAGNHGQAMWQGGPTQPGTCTRVNYDQPGAIQAYQWYQEMTCKNHLSPSDDEASKISKSGVTGIFLAGNAAMEFSFDQRGFFVDSIKSNFKWDWALPPLGDKKKPPIVSNIGGGIAIFALSKVKDTAWQYLEFTNNPSYLIESVKANGARDVYSNRKVQEAPEYLASTVPPSNKKLLVDAINNGKFFPEPYWEMKALKIAEPSPPKGTPAATSCGADAAKLLTEQAKVDNEALKAHNIAVCA